MLRSQIREVHWRSKRLNKRSNWLTNSQLIPHQIVSYGESYNWMEGKEEQLEDEGK